MQMTPFTFRHQRMTNLSKKNKLKLLISFFIGNAVYLDKFAQDIINLKHAPGCKGKLFPKRCFTKRLGVPCGCFMHVVGVATQ